MDEIRCRVGTVNHMSRDTEACRFMGEDSCGWLRHFPSDTGSDPRSLHLPNDFSKITVPEIHSTFFPVTP